MPLIFNKIGAAMLSTQKSQGLRGLIFVIPALILPLVNCGGNPLSPVILDQPMDQKVEEGTTVTFSVTATGSPSPAYQWHRNGQAIDGAKAANYTLVKVQRADSGAKFFCNVTNTQGEVRSREALLTIKDGGTDPQPDPQPQAEAPKFTTEPVGQTATVGTSVVFNVAVTGKPAPTLQWQKNGANIPNANGATLELKAVSDADAGSYAVVAKNSAGSLTSKAATLVVTPAPIPDEAPKFTSEPTAQTVTVGGTATFKVTVTGKPAPLLQWRKNGDLIQGQNGNSLEIKNAQLADGGNYDVVAGNTVAIAYSKVVALTVKDEVEAPKFTTQPVAQTVVEGGKATFKVEATGKPAPTFQWRKDKIAIQGATQATYEIAAVKATDAGSYDVVASNTAGNVPSGAAALTVNLNAPAPKILVEPQDVEVFLAEGAASATFEVKAENATGYQWTKNGANVSGATESTFVYAVGESDNGTKIAVLVKGANGQSVASRAALVKFGTPEPYELISGPEEGKEYEVPLGGSYEFKLVCKGKPLEIHWLKAGEDAVLSTTNVLRLENITAETAGNYLYAVCCNGQCMAPVVFSVVVK